MEVSLFLYNSSKFDFFHYSDAISFSFCSAYHSDKTENKLKNRPKPGVEPGTSRIRQALSQLSYICILYSMLQRLYDENN